MSVSCGESLSRNSPASYRELVAGEIDNYSPTIVTRLYQSGLIRENLEALAQQTFSG